MEISIQYLEGAPGIDEVSPADVRRRLHDAFERIPFDMVLLGWDLDPRLVEACAEECAHFSADLYLWQPLLSAHGPFHADPAWAVIGPDGKPLSGPDHQPGFTFACPNNEAARESALQCLSDALSPGCYQGIFLDRIRLPSPSADPVRQFGCFCEACREAAEAQHLDLTAVRDGLLRLTASREGRRLLVAHMLSASARAGDSAVQLLDQMLVFRQQSITNLIAQVAEAIHSVELKVGLDCYSPTLTRMVGQDLPALTAHADWIKVMTYARSFGTACIPFELIGLADWLIAGQGETEAEALDFLAKATRLPIPDSRAAIRSNLPASILTEELRRGRGARPKRLLAGIEMVEVPGLSQLSEEQIRLDAHAVRLAQPDGVMLCWDLRHIPTARLDLAEALYYYPTIR